jgi:hypothetical protein
MWRLSPSVLHGFSLRQFTNNLKPFQFVLARLRAKWKTTNAAKGMWPRMEELDMQGTESTLRWTLLAHDDARLSGNKILVPVCHQIDSRGTFNSQEMHQISGSSIYILLNP